MNKWGRNIGVRQQGAPVIGRIEVSRNKKFWTYLYGRPKPIPDMTYRLSIFFFILISYRLQAQFKPVECTTEQDKNIVRIIASNKAPGTYSAKLEFSIFEGLQPLPVEDSLYPVPMGKNTLLEFKIPRGAQPDLQYSFKIYEGKVYTQAPGKNPGFLLPSTAGNTLTYQEGYYIAERPGQQPPADYKSYYFEGKSGDTICASHGGKVTKINEDIRAMAYQKGIIKGSRNIIRIEHADGTLTTYTFLHPIHSQVTVGQSIDSGQPLAILNQESEHYGVFVCHYYLDAAKLAVAGKGSPTNYIYSYLPIDFHTENQTPLSYNQSYRVILPKRP
jgi:hypothetical protein